MESGGTYLTLHRRMKPAQIAPPSFPPPQDLSQASCLSHSAWHVGPSPTVGPPFFLCLPGCHLSSPNFSPRMCFFLLLCTVGSFSEHLDQINGRSECVDSTDNSSKPSSEPTSHVARQRLESTEKKKISGKVTKSLSASALSLMIPGGRETSTRMQTCMETRMPLCDSCLCFPPSSPNLECWLECRTAWSGIPGQLSRAAAHTPVNVPSRASGTAREHVHLQLCSQSVPGEEAREVSFPWRRLSFVFLKPFLPTS